MNLKTANLVAVQFGMFVGMMSWLAYSLLESAEPRKVNSISPISEPAGQRPYAIDHGAGRERAKSVAEQPVSVAYEYSAEAVQQYSDLAAQQYYQQIAPRHYASPGLENGAIVADAPPHAEVAQAPVAVQPDYPEAPQTVAYVQPTQFIAYPQSIVVFSNRRRLPNRCRSTPHSGALMPATHRHPDRPRSQPNGNGLAPRQNASAPTCRPTQEFESKGKR